MKKVLVFMLVISMLLVCSGFATATEAISFPNGRVVSNGIEKPTKEDVETQYVLAGMEISDIDFITGDYEMVTASSVRSVPVTEPCDQTWRAKYPDSWMWEANRTIKAADDIC